MNLIIYLIMSSMIKNICGSSDLVLPDIGTDPNYVFSNDPLFETIVLYDPQGNIINVNSWIECAHYVNGGWSNNITTTGGEELILYGIVFCFFSYFLFKKFIIKND
jgi:hypothetical protein